MKRLMTAFVTAMLLAGSFCGATRPRCGSEPGDELPTLPYGLYYVYAERTHATSGSGGLSRRSTGVHRRLHQAVDSYRTTSDAKSAKPEHWASPISEVAASACSSFPPAYPVVVQDHARERNGSDAIYPAILIQFPAARS